MRALPFLAALLCTAPFAGAKTELELLQDRCAEQERQIRQLEEENGRLKSIVTTATKTSAPAEAAPTEAPVTPPPATTTPAYGVVKKGDTISSVAKRHGTTTATLIKLNKLKNPSLIRPGQKLRLPDKAASTPASAATHGTHVVKAGETLYSIARHYGLSPVTLEAANPSVRAEALRPGQVLRLGAKSAPAATKAPEPTPSPAKSSIETPAPAESASQTVAAAPRIRSVAIAENTNFGAFAAAHGTSTAKLNALNGLNLNPSTVLAKGSELYVPAQP